MPRVTDHTRTEKIGGDSILIFVVIQVVAGNRYDSLATPLGNKRVRPISSHMLSSMLFTMLNLSVLYFCDVFMASFVYVLIIVVLFTVCL